jgi:hypothetical protein
MWPDVAERAADLAAFSWRGIRTELRATRDTRAIRVAVRSEAWPDCWH